MTMPQPTPAELLKKFGELIDAPLSTRAQFRELFHQFERVPVFRRATRSDPIREALEELLMLSAPDAQGIVSINGVPMTVQSICKDLGLRMNASTTTRIGKLLAAMGYTRVRCTRVLPPRFRAPRAPA